VGKVELIVTPLALHKVGRQHKDQLVAPLYAVNDILHDAFARDEVPLVLAQPHTALPFLQVWDQLIRDPHRIARAVRNEGVKLQSRFLLSGATVPSPPLRLRPLPSHPNVPRGIKVDTQKGHDGHQHQRHEQRDHKQE
ncbi:hypothetical protein N309_03884, partial [Tinamus guttatus]